MTYHLYFVSLPKWKISIYIMKSALNACKFSSTTILSNWKFQVFSLIDSTINHLEILLINYWNVLKRFVNVIFFRMHIKLIWNMTSLDFECKSIALYYFKIFNSFKVLGDHVTTTSISRQNILIISLKSRCYNIRTTVSSDDFLHIQVADYVQV